MHSHDRSQLIEFVDGRAVNSPLQRTHVRPAADLREIFLAQAFLFAHGSESCAEPLFKIHSPILNSGNWALSAFELYTATPYTVHFR